MTGQPSQGWDKGDFNSVLHPQKSGGMTADVACCRCGGGECEAGYYPEVIIGPKPFNEGRPPLKCLACERGKYGQQGGTSCIKCEAGKYQPNSGRGACEVCPAGTYASATGSEKCNGCFAGTFSPRSASSCSSCPSGRFNQRKGAALCEPCPKGSYSHSQGEAQCKSCEAGTFTSNKGKSECKQCPIGNYSSNDGMWYCPPCPPGTFSNETGAVECAACPPGKSRDLEDKRDDCILCAIGRYNSLNGSANCTLCPVGAYEAETGSLACTNCSVGKQSHDDRSRCTACLPGWFSSAPASGTCSLCEKGTFSSAAQQSGCVLCSSGRTAPSPGNTNCTSCSAGTFVPTIGGLSCLDCPVGFFASNADMSQCERCPDGRVTAKARTTECIACFVGKYANSSQRCVSCPTGRYASTREESECTKCEKGYYGDAEGLTACDKPCDGGTVTNETGMSKCNVCPTGTESERGIACIPCERGRYQPGVGQDQCEQCALGAFGNETGLTECYNCQIFDKYSWTTNSGSKSQMDCKCKPEYYFSKGKCKKCDEFLFECPGGHPITNRSNDVTVMIKDGYMSVRSEPLRIYSCVRGRMKRCTGERNAYDGRMCADGFQDVRCALCEAGRFLNTGTGTCEECISDGLVAKGILYCFLFWLGCGLLIVYMYIRWNREQQSGIITVGMLVSYVQVVQKVCQLPLSWPKTLATLLDTAGRVSVGGSMGVSGFHYMCLIGNDFRNQLYLEVFLPITPIIQFFQLYIVSKISPRMLTWFMQVPLNSDHIINTIGGIYEGIYITITGIALQLFVGEKMPDSSMPDVPARPKRMVKDIPELEIGTAQWLQVLPLAVVAFCVYAMTFLAFTAHAVYVAPSRAATDPGFESRYRFAFGAFRPDCWWWVLVHTIYSLVLVAVQSLDQSQMRIYCTTLILIVVIVLQFQVQPYKFTVNNTVDLRLKSSLLIFLVIVSGFIDPGEVSSASFRQGKETFGMVALGVIVLAVGYSARSVVVWGIAFATNPSLAVNGSTLQLAMQFRDVMARLAVMSDRDFMLSLVKLSEADLLQFRDSMHTTIAVFLKLQPSRSLLHQRIMTGVPFRIWDPYQMSLEALESCIDGTVQKAMMNNAKSRLMMMKLAKEIRHQLQHGSTHSLRPASPAELLGALGLRDTVRHSKLEFCKLFSPVSHISEPELEKIFDMMDCTEEGKMKLEEFMNVLMAGAPPLDDKFEQHLEQLRSLESKCCGDQQAYTSLTPESDFDGSSCASEGVPHEQVVFRRDWHRAMRTMQAAKPLCLMSDEDSCSTASLAPPVLPAAPDLPPPLPPPPPMPMLQSQDDLHA